MTSKGGGSLLSILPACKLLLPPTSDLLTSRQCLFGHLCVSEGVSVGGGLGWRRRTRRRRGFTIINWGLSLGWAQQKYIFSWAEITPRSSQQHSVLPQSSSLLLLLLLEMSELAFSHIANFALHQPDCRQSQFRQL